MSRPKVLLVDDEVHVLEGYRRHLRKHFTIVIHSSPEEALDELAGDDDFGVVVSDFRMPGMNGVEFLSLVREHHPAITRVMLTGQADYQATIEAVNRGNIFRFLSKPCPPDALVSAIEDAMQLHELVVAEKELIEGTVNGAVAALGDLVGLANPDALVRSSRIRELAMRLADVRETESRWMLEMAATLSQIGCMTLPTEVVSAGLSGATMSERDRTLYESHPKIGVKLLGQIPRLEGVSALLGSQFGHTIPSDRLAQVGLSSELAEVFGLAATFAELSARHGVSQALQKVASSSRWSPDLVKALAEDETEMVTSLKRVTCSVSELIVGMVADQDVVATSGVLLVSRGHHVTAALLERLRNFHARVGIVEPIRMLVRSIR